MSNQTGIDYYDLLVSRIHGGVCAFQSLRAHRRDRTHDNAPPLAARTDPPPPAAYSDAASDERPGPMVLEPQGFIAHGGRVLPLFGDVRAVFHGAPPPVEASQMTPPPTRSAPMPEELPLLVQDPPSSRPASASTLKLPLPTPPSRLGLVGRPAESPAPAPEPSAPPASTTTASDGATAPQHTAPSGHGIEALLTGRAQAEAARLEQVHAEHRACLAMLLHEHRAELHAQADADAARATQLVRELLAEHRAELTRTADAQAGRLALVFSQHREEMEATRAEQPEAASAPQSEVLCTALIEQAKLQREANEDIVQHIAEVTGLVADLGQTVGLLAVAVYDARQVRVPTVSLPPPPRVGGTVGAVATAAMTTLGVSSATSSPVPAASPPAPAAATVGRTLDAANVGTTLAPASVSTPSPCRPVVPRTVDTSTPGACTPTRASPAAENALASERVADFDDDDDDDDLSNVVDPECGHTRLAPVTPIVRPDFEATHV